MYCHLSVNLQAYIYAIAENNDIASHVIFTNLPDLKMPVAIVTGGNKGIGLGVVRICLSNLSANNIYSMFPFEVRGLCKQFKGEVYLTARDEARGKVKLALITCRIVQPIVLLEDYVFFFFQCWFLKGIRDGIINCNTTAQT